jgi:signal transduction histidine kinase
MLSPDERGAFVRKCSRAHHARIVVRFSARRRGHAGEPMTERSMPPDGPHDGVATSAAPGVPSAVSRERVFAAGQAEARELASALAAQAAEARAFKELPGFFSCVMEVRGDDFVIRSPNARTAAFFGMTADQLDGRSGEDLYVPREHRLQWCATLRQTRACREGGQIEYSVVSPVEPCKARWFVASFAPIDDGSERERYAFVAVETSARRELEAKLECAEKFELIGRLAAGVAHDFNNLLTVIRAHTERLQRRVRSSVRPAPPSTDGLEDRVARLSGPNADVDEDLTQIELAGVRATALTRQLLTFARQQIVEPRLVRVDDVVRDACRLVEYLVGADVQLDVALGAQGAEVRIDPSQLEQVVLNLAMNARDAMPKGGALSLGTRVEEGKVVLAVSDTGVGISDEVRARLFEPFFTTKPDGKGTGLGLATCRTIVAQSGGTVTFATERGRGTTFEVRLPIASFATIVTDAVCERTLESGCEPGGAPSSGRLRVASPGTRTL